ncbi:NAD-binding protein [Ideonella paludis]|uniref:NAD-binding protein n=2 Tax=Ideonella paludis TaxID=1233411 RepID=A0ABS5DXC6_9BURK|nr:NAD-binding protein [Ideonella paludis]
MGFALLQRLRSEGWPVVVHDIDPQRCKAAKALGATVARHAAEVAQHCRQTLVVVVDAAQTAEVLWGDHGLHTQARPGDVVWLCPTLGPQDVEDAAARLAALGVTVMDAPMSGGPLRAQQGEMSLMLAGPPFVLQAHEALLSTLARQRFVISDKAGDAARTKLLNNLLAAINLAGAAEVLALAQQWGLNARQTLSVIEASSGQSWIGSDRLRRALDNDFAPRAHTTLLAKDSRLALEACALAGSPTPGLGQMAAQRFAQACEQGLGALDDASLFLQAGGQPEPAAAQDEAAALRACTELAAHLGLGGVQAQVLGRFSNLAVGLPPHGMVARVATGTARWRAAEQAQHEMAVAQALAHAGAPAVRPAVSAIAGAHRHLAGPHAWVSQGRTWHISLWQRAEVLTAQPEPIAAGQALAACHAALAQASLPLRADWGMFEEVHRLLDDPYLLHQGAAPDDVALVRHLTQACQQRLHALCPALQALHGDAHLNNVWATPQGPLWGDWEDTIHGPVEWDAACLVAGARVLGTEVAWSEAALQGWWQAREAQGVAPSAALLDECVLGRTLFVTAWLWALGAAQANPERQARLAGRLAWLRAQA